MIQCLINNKICSNANKRCKNCVFDECKEVINMNEEIQKYEDLENMRKLKKELPEQCKKLLFFRDYKLTREQSILSLHD